MLTYIHHWITFIRIGLYGKVIGYSHDPLDSIKGEKYIPLGIIEHYIFKEQGIIIKLPNVYKGVDRYINQQSEIVTSSGKDYKQLHLTGLLLNGG